MPVDERACPRYEGTECNPEARCGNCVYGMTGTSSNGRITVFCRYDTNLDGDTGTSNPECPACRHHPAFWMPEKGTAE